MNLLVLPEDQDGVMGCFVSADEPRSLLWLLEKTKITLLLNRFSETEEQ